MENEEKVYGGYTRDQLLEAFRLVKNTENWKMPVNAVIPGDSDLALMESAVIFFTGSVPFFVEEDKDHVRVHADGYYRAIGS